MIILLLSAFVWQSAALSAHPYALEKTVLTCDHEETIVGKQVQCILGFRDATGNPTTIRVSELDSVSLSVRPATVSHVIDPPYPDMKFSTRILVETTVSLEVFVEALIIPDASLGRNNSHLVSTRVLFFPASPVPTSSEVLCVPPVVCAGETARCGIIQRDRFGNVVPGNALIGFNGFSGSPGSAYEHMRPLPPLLFTGTPLNLSAAVEVLASRALPTVRNAPVPAAYGLHPAVIVPTQPHAIVDDIDMPDGRLVLTVAVTVLSGASQSATPTVVSGTLTITPCHADPAHTLLVCRCVDVPSLGKSPRHAARVCPDTAAAVTAVPPLVCGGLAATNVAAPADSGAPLVGLDAAAANALRARVEGVAAARGARVACSVSLRDAHGNPAVALPEALRRNLSATAAYLGGGGGGTLPTDGPALVVAALRARVAPRGVVLTATDALCFGDDGTPLMSRGPSVASFALGLGALPAGAAAAAAHGDSAAFPLAGALSVVDRVTVGDLAAVSILPQAGSSGGDVSPDVKAAVNNVAFVAFVAAPAHPPTFTATCGRAQGGAMAVCVVTVADRYGGTTTQWSQEDIIAVRHAVTTMSTVGGGVNASAQIGTVTSSAFEVLVPTAVGITTVGEVDFFVPDSYVAPTADGASPTNCAGPVGTAVSPAQLACTDAAGLPALPTALKQQPPSQASGSPFLVSVTSTAYTRSHDGVRGTLYRVRLPAVSSAPRPAAAAATLITCTTNPPTLVSPSDLASGQLGPLRIRLRGLWESAPSIDRWRNVDGYTEVPGGYAKIVSTVVCSLTMRDVDHYSGLLPIPSTPPSQGVVTAVGTFVNTDGDVDAGVERSTFAAAVASLPFGSARVALRQSRHAYSVTLAPPPAALGAAWSDGGEYATTYSFRISTPPGDGARSRAATVLAAAELQHEDHRVRERSAVVAADGVSVVHTVTVGPTHGGSATVASFDLPIVVEWNSGSESSEQNYVIFIVVAAALVLAGLFVVLMAVLFVLYGATERQRRKKAYHTAAALANGDEVDRGAV